MKNLKWLFLIVFMSSILLPSCDLDIDIEDDDDGLSNCEDGDGVAVREELNVADFEKIKLEIPGKVFITQGSPLSVEVEAQTNIIDLIELDVNNDTWDIELERCARDFSEIKFFITMPTIKSIEVTGTGDVVSENTITGEDLRLRMSGTGDMDLAVDIEDEIDGKITGTGKMKMEGEAKRLDFEVTGPGDLRAFDLTVENAKIRMTGTGDVELTVLETLEVDITGTGDVFYKGEPTVDIEITGTGEVVNSN